MSDYSEHLISMAGGDGEADVLGEIEARANAATPGPWAWEGESGDSWPQSDNSLVTAYVPDGREWPESILSGWGYDASGISVEKDADGEFIAHARTDIPALLAMVREQRAVIERVEAVADKWWANFPSKARAIRAALATPDQS